MPLPIFIFVRVAVRHFAPKQFVFWRGLPHGVAEFGGRLLDLASGGWHVQLLSLFGVFVHFPELTSQFFQLFEIRFKPLCASRPGDLAYGGKKSSQETKSDCCLKDTHFARLSIGFRIGVQQ
jgi:hypothetical protein